MRVCIFIDGENLRHTICHLFDNRRNPQNAPLFDEQEYLPRQAKWGDFFGYLAEKSKIPEVHAHFSRAYWYVVNAVYAKPWLPKSEWDPKIQKRRFIESDLSDWHQRNQKGIRNLVDFFNKRAIGNQAKMSAEFGGVEKVIAELQRRKTRIDDRFAGFAVIQKGIARAHGQIEFRRSGGIGYDLFMSRLNREKTIDVNLAVDMMRLKDIYDIAVIVSGDQDFVPAAAAVKDLGKKVVNVSFRQKNDTLLPSGASQLNETTDSSVEVDYDDFQKFLFPDKK